MDAGVIFVIDQLAAIVICTVSVKVVPASNISLVPLGMVSFAERLKLTPSTGVLLFAVPTMVLEVAKETKSAERLLVTFPELLHVPSSTTFRLYGMLAAEVEEAFNLPVSGDAFSEANVTVQAGRLDLRLRTAPVVVLSPVPVKSVKVSEVVAPRLTSKTCCTVAETLKSAANRDPAARLTIANKTKNFFISTSITFIPHTAGIVTKLINAGERMKGVGVVENAGSKTFFLHYIKLG